MKEFYAKESLVFMTAKKDKFEYQSCIDCGKTFFPKAKNQSRCHDPCYGRKKLSIEEINQNWINRQKPKKRSKFVDRNFNRFGLDY